MLRRVTRHSLLPVTTRRASSTTAVAAAAATTAVATSQCWANHVAHWGQLLSTKSIAPATFISGPLGTLSMELIAYNVTVVGLRHLWYTLEIVVRDYIQDWVLAQWLRYFLLIILLLTGEQLFIEA